MNTKYQILKDIFNYSSSALIAQALALISGFFVAHLLGPADFGVWNAVSLILGYGAYLEFGVLGTMGRDLPFYLGEGNIEKALSVEGAARRTTIVGAISGAILIFLYSLIASLSRQMIFGLQIISLGLILQQVYTYQRVVLRSYNQFSELSKQQMLQAIFSAVLTLVFVVYFALDGRIIAAVLVQALILLYALFRNPLRTIPKFEWQAVWSLIRVGIPISISGFILSLMITIDRLMIITFLGEKELGLFGLAILIVSVVTLIPTMAGQVLYPKITFRYGNSGKSVESIRSLVITPPKILSAFLPILIGTLYIILPFVITKIMPAYSDGIKAAQIVIIGIYFFGIMGLTDYLLVTIGKLKQYICFGIIALLSTISIDYVFLKLGYGIEGIALGGKLITYFIYSTIVIGYALSHFTKQPSDWIRYFIRIWSPFLYMITLIWFVEIVIDNFVILIPSQNILFAMTTKIILYIFGCLPLIYIAFRELKLDFSKENFQN